MELVRRATLECKFPDGSAVSFDIEAPTREDRKVILEQCRKPRSVIGGQRGEELIDKLDFERFQRMVILRAVKGWTGLKNKHLLTVYDSKDKADKWEFKGDKRRETEVPFDQEALRELAEMHSADFWNWLSDTALDGIDEANAKAKEAELKN